MFLVAAWRHRDVAICPGLFFVAGFYYVLAFDSGVHVCLLAVPPLQARLGHLVHDRRSAQPLAGGHTACTRGLRLQAPWGPGG